MITPVQLLYTVIFRAPRVGALFGIVWALALPLRAQVTLPCPAITTEPTLVYGQRLVGCSLARASDRSLFAFQGSSRDLVRVTLRKQGGQGTPCLELYDPRGAQVGGQGCASLDFRTPLRQDGGYQIVVHERRAEDVFQYELTLDRLLPPSATSTALQSGDAISDEINYPGDYDLFHFTAVKGQLIWFNFLKIGGPGVPCAEILDPNGQPAALFGYAGSRVVNPYCLRDPYFPSLAIRISDTGTHLISIAEEGDDQLAKYQLRLLRIDPPSAASHSLAFGTQFSGTAGPFSRVDTSYFEVAKGDSIHFAIDMFGECFGYEVYDSDGNRIDGVARPQSLCGAEFYTYPLPNSGRYVVLTAGADDNRTIPYEIFVTCSGQCPSPQPVPVPILTADPAMASFQMLEGSTDQARQLIRVSTSGQESPLLLTPITDSWLSVTPSGASGLGTLLVAVSPHALPAGTYNSRVLLQTESGGLLEVPVSLQVLPQTTPAFDLDAPSLQFNVKGDQIDSQQLVRIVLMTSRSGQNLEVTVSSKQKSEWLAVSPSAVTVSPSQTAVIEIHVQPNRLPGGVLNYADSIVVSAGGRSREIPVIVSIVDDTDVQPLFSTTGVTLFTLPGQNGLDERSFLLYNAGVADLDWLVEGLAPAIRVTRDSFDKLVTGKAQTLTATTTENAALLKAGERLETQASFRFTGLNQPRVVSVYVQVLSADQLSLPPRPNTSGVILGPPGFAEARVTLRNTRPNANGPAVFTIKPPAWPSVPTLMRQFSRS